ncbi:MAG: tetratricopeptide repeat protein [Bryobacteraceae bacterium]|jgi:tetratricopeptide (TPR) repeat protein
MMKSLLLLPALFAINGFNDSDLIKARDRQDKAALEKVVGDLKPQAEKDPKDAVAQYRLALAESYSAEVAIETHDKAAAKNAAQAGIDAAERAVALKADSSEYQRILGTLCGQMISGMGLAGLKYGKCALTAVNKAIELDPKSSINYLSHGVGNYYLPAALGGGYELAIKDFRKAIELDGKNADAYLWLGVALRKVNQPEEAHKAIAKSVELNPNRIWAKQQLDKTPTN